MRYLSRRKFIKLCSAGAAGLGLAQTPLPSVAAAFTAASRGKPVVLWLQGAACSGCTSSLMNSTYPQLKQLLQDIVEMRFHPQLVSTQLTLEALLQVAQEHRGRYILVLEGAIPTAKGGVYGLIHRTEQRTSSFLDVVQTLGQGAKFILAAGTCAAYGGIAAAQPNPGDCVGANNLLPADKVLNVPGCPPHPDWLIGSLAHVLMYGEMPERDDFGRARVFYEGVVHDNCPRRQYFDNSNFALVFGEPGCLLEVGCRGPMAFADCYNRQWNGGQNWCIRSGGPCLTCTHPNFPDGTTPVFKRMPNVSVLGITTTADTIGKVAAAATALGVGIHLVGSYLAGRIGTKVPVKGGENHG
ncbi:MAG: hydrogenase small subunit [Clostridia bacterium]|nr:hydrogenase small subunit [Clostridia bacterium]